MKTIQRERDIIRRAINRGDDFDPSLALDVIDDADELTRLREGLMNLHQWYETWPNRAPFISVADIEALLNNGGGDE